MDPQFVVTLVIIPGNDAAPHNSHRTHRHSSAVGRPHAHHRLASARLTCQRFTMRHSTQFNHTHSDAFRPSPRIPSLFRCREAPCTPSVGKCEANLSAVHSAAACGRPSSQTCPIPLPPGASVSPSLILVGKSFRSSRQVTCSKDFVCNHRRHSSRAQRASLSLGIRFEASIVMFTPWRVATIIIETRIRSPSALHAYFCGKKQECQQRPFKAIAHRSQVRD